MKIYLQFLYEDTKTGFASQPCIYEYGMYLENIIRLIITNYLATEELKCVKPNSTF